MKIPFKVQQTNTWPLAVLRISVGIMFSIAAFHKISAGSEWPQRMVGFLNFHAEKSYGFYRTLLESIVLPNSQLFGYLVAYGEAFVAISLLIGILARWGALIGLLMVTNFLLAKGTGFWVPSANDPMFILALLTLLFTDSGKILGIDVIIVNKWPKHKLIWI